MMNFAIVVVCLLAPAALNMDYVGWWLVISSPITVAGYFHQKQRIKELGG